MHNEAKLAGLRLSAVEFLEEPVAQYRERVRSFIG
jgi:hypothetical protein